MSYYTGTAASMTALRTAITDALVLQGWTWDAGEQIAHKGTMFFQLTVGTVSTANHPYLALRGTTALTGGELTPNLVCIREFNGLTFIYPITYHIFIFVDEVWVVVGHGNANYMHMAFGKSNVPGFPGTGSYVAANYGWSTLVGLGAFTSGVQPVLFSGDVRNLTERKSYFVHTDIPGYGGNKWEPTLDGNNVGWGHVSPLLNTQPNNFTQEALLLPIRTLLRYPVSKYGLVLQLEHARYTRNDFIEDEQIIELGPDRWMIFPAGRKNIAARSQNLSEATEMRTGTYAIALRYDGP